MNLQITLIKNLLGTVSENEIKYQLDQIEIAKKWKIEQIKNLIGKVSNNEIKYQLDQLKGEN